MDTFFKDDNVIVDVDGGNVIEVLSGKVMTLDFVNMTMKSFTTKSKLAPIRFSSNNKEILFWEPLKNRWINLKERYPKNVVNAVEKLIQVKIEKELLD